MPINPSAPNEPREAASHVCRSCFLKSNAHAGDALCARGEVFLSVEGGWGCIPDMESLSKCHEQLHKGGVGCVCVGGGHYKAHYTAFSDLGEIPDAVTVINTE